jgi:hypothetical protein
MQVLHMQIEEGSEAQPRFEFQSPRPDLSASLQLLHNYLNVFLTAEGLDPRTISGKSDGSKYTSGLDRLLAMLDKFEASRDDVDAFYKAEQDVFELVKLWLDAFAGVTVASGQVQPLNEDLRGAQIPDGAYIEVNYAKPKSVQTNQELEESVGRRLELGLISRAEAIMEVRMVGEEAAEEIMKKIDQADGLVSKQQQDSAVQKNPEEPEDDTEDAEESKA